MGSEPRPAPPRDAEIVRLFRALGEQRAAATTTPRGKLALDALAAEVEARLTRLAQRKEAADGA